MPSTPHKHHSLANLTWLFDGLASLLGPLSFLLYLLPVLVVAGAWTIFSHPDLFQSDLARYWAQLNLVQHLILSAFTVNLASELLLGIVARRMGALTPSFGLRYAFGLVPRFETQLGGMEELSKRTRLWIHATPILVRFAIFGLGVILWYATRTSGNQMPAYWIMLALVSLISQLSTANPLMRSSAYTMLCIWLDIPNLRQRANRALFRRGGVRQGMPEGQGDQVALRLYALASLIFFLVFFGVVLWFIGRALELHYQGTGVSIFLVLLVYLIMRFRNQIKSRRAEMREAFGDRAAMGAGRRMRENFPEPEEEDEEPGPKRGWVWLRLLLLVVIIVVLFLPYPYETGGSLVVLPAQRQEIHPQREGILEKSYFSGGEWVRKGTPVAKLASHEQEKDVLTTRAALQEQQALLEKLRNTPTPEQLAVAEKDLATAITQAQFSRQTHLRYKQLFESRFVSEEKVEETRRQVDVDDAQVLTKKANLELVKNSVQPEQIVAQEAEIQRLKELLAYYEGELQRTYLYMPIDGRLVTMNLHFMEGKFMLDSALFAIAEDDRQVPIELSIPESDIGELAKGKKARIKVWTYTDREFEGIISEISPVVTKNEIGTVIKVQCVVPNEQGLLRSGMTGFGKVETRTMPVYEAFSRMLVRFVVIEAWSWLP